ncbi:MAG: hypothetical protein WAV45_16360 [Propionibacteriaceae bacterium]|mgnify:CR=1 FL=1|nr:hypothetical protein [Micropruina sp.]HBX82421.1 hypothetical protein [Propionibacteriaceae bacterium]HBY21911.1 hypothetical protein [Propionibacteriaceae bacterium]
MNKNENIPAARRIALFCAAAAMGGIAAFGTVSVASAAPTPAPAPTAAQTETSDVVDAETAAYIAQDDAEFAGLDMTLPPVDVAAENAEADAFAKYLSDHGVKYTTSDSDGVKIIEIDYNDPAALQAEEDYFWSTAPMSQQAIDDNNADIDKAAAALTAAGIDNKVTTDKHGVKDIAFNMEDDKAAEVLNNLG